MDEHKREKEPDEFSEVVGALQSTDNSLRFMSKFLSGQDQTLAPHYPNRRTNSSMWFSNRNDQTIEKSHSRILVRICSIVNFPNPKPNQKASAVHTIQSITKSLLLVSNLPEEREKKKKVPNDQPPSLRRPTSESFEKKNIP